MYVAPSRAADMQDEGRGLFGWERSKTITVPKRDLVRKVLTVLDGQNQKRMFWWRPRSGISYRASLCRIQPQPDMVSLPSEPPTFIDSLSLLSTVQRAAFDRPHANFTAGHVKGGK